MLGIIQANSEPDGGVRYVCVSVSVHLVRDRLSSAAERFAKQMDNTDHLGTAILKPASGICFFLSLSFSLSLSLSLRPGKPPSYVRSFSDHLSLLFCRFSIATLVCLFSLIIFTAVTFN